MYFPNPDLPNNHTLEAAVANACFLNEMIRQSHLVHIANFSDLVNGWVGGCIRVGDHYERMKKSGWSGHPHIIFGTATYHLLRLYANRQIHRIVDTKVLCPTFDAGVSKLELQLDKLPILDVVTCISEYNDILTMFIVNRSLESVPLTCDLTAWRPMGDALLYVIAGDHYEAYNTVFEPNIIREEILSTRIGGANWSYELQPHAIYVLEVPLIIS
jgi:alpha-N-arabinofuranosidase